MSGVYNQREIDISVLADIYGPLLTPRQLDFLREYIDYDLSYAEIAQKHGIARQSVKDAITAAQVRLKSLEDVLQIAHKQRRIAELIHAARERQGGGVDDILTEISQLI